MKKLLLTILFLFVCSPASATNWCNDSAVVGCWTLDETTGDAIDQSSNGNDGTLTGATQGVSGKFGTAYSFGGDGDRVKFGSAPELDDLPSGDFTIVHWIYPDSCCSGSDKVSTKRNTSSDGGGGWIATVTDTNTVRFLTVDAAIDADFVADNSSISTGSWQHYAIIFTTAGDDAEIYIDGEEVSYATQTSGDGANSDAGDELVIGASTNGGSPSYDGDIDDFAIFNEAKTPTDINEILDFGLIPVSTTVFSKFKFMN